MTKPNEHAWTLANSPSEALAFSSQPRKSRRVPLDQRRYVIQACATCRTRKTKCDGRRPRCRTCEGDDRQCSYDGDSDRRRAPTWAYVHTVEQRVQELEAELLLLRQREPSSSFPGINEPFLYDGVAVMPQVAGDDGHILDPAMIHKTLIRNHRGDLRMFGPSSPFYHLPSAPEEIFANPEGLRADPDSGYRRYLPPSVGLTLQQHDLAIDLYFDRLASPWCRIPESDFRRDMASVLQGPSTQDSCRTQHYSPMLHNLILAISTLASSMSAAPSRSEVVARAETFFDYALRWFHVEVDRMTLCTLSSMALITTYCASTGEPSKGWSYFGMIAAMVRSMGLTLQTGTVFPSRELDLDIQGCAERQRALCNFYTADAFWSLYLGRGTLYWASDVLPDYPPSGDELADDQGRAELELARLARDVLNDTYDLDAGGKSSSALTLRIESWEKALAPNITLPAQLRHLSRIQRGLPATILLHANASLVQLAFWRPRCHHMRVGDQNSSVSPRARCEAASVRIVALADAWDRIYSLSAGPMQLCHALFMAGTTFLLLSAQQLAGQKSARRTYAQHLDAVERQLSTLGLAWSGAVQIGELLSTLRLQWDLKPSPD